MNPERINSEQVKLSAEMILKLIIGRESRKHGRDGHGQVSYLDVAAVAKKQYHLDVDVETVKTLVEGWNKGKMLSEDYD